MSTKGSYKVAIVGATGAVGREMLDVLDKRGFALSSLLLFASPRSLGKKIKFKNESFECQVLKSGCFDGVNFAFFDASDEISKQWVPEALKSGAWVIDNSATWRLDEKTPLVVPEVNAQSIKNSSKKLIAGPNCTTAQLVMALKPLHDTFQLKRVIVSTYQSVSGAGTLAIEELKNQTVDYSQNKPLTAKVLKHPIAFNCIPHIGSFDSEGHTSEEIKVIQETRKILNLPHLAVSCTAVRVPTLLGHAESVNVEFEKPCDVQKAKDALKKFKGIVVLDEPQNNSYPMNQNLTKDDVLVGRIRKDPSCPNGLQFWIVSDNLRKGAALNALQIAESILAIT